MNLKGKKIIVTGGAGFIGSHIVEDLIRQGAKVTVYDNLSTGKLEYLETIRKKIAFIKGDIVDNKKLRRACKGQDIISHQAAQLEIFKAIEDPVFDLEVNTIGTLNILKAARDFRIKKVINASSVSVYGQAVKVPQKETDPTDPNWAYGVGKLAAEKYCRIFNEQYGIPIVNLRYGQVYGVREWFGRALTVFIKRMLDKQPIAIFGDGKQVRDYIYVSDVVNCHDICLKNDKVKNGIFNVGSGKGISIIEIAKTVKDVFGDKTKLVFEKTKEGEVSKLVPYRRRIPCELRKMYMSIDRAKKVLKWRTKVSLAEGIRKEVDWLKANPSAWNIKGVVKNIMLKTNTKNWPIISFVTPTYNAERCLERCLKSITEQDYPRDKIDIVIADGGSDDSTLEIAKRYRARIFDNPRRLAEYGLAIAVQNSIGDFLILAASDNELEGKDWLKRMLLPFQKDKNLSAEWGRMISAKDDCSINHYYAIIQNDPLTFFTNQNLKKYIMMNRPIRESGEKYYIFDAKADMPLPWGANCLIYKSADVKHFWERVEYIGDNDVFQMMLEEGKTHIAYNDNLLIYHHTVGTLFDWIGKWKRNMGKHFLANRETRNLNWIHVKHFNLKLILWVIYSIFLPVSLAHSVILALKDRNVYWLYHPFVSLAQALTYLYVVLSTEKGYNLIRDFFSGKKI